MLTISAAGYVASDPEMGEFDGTPVANFRILDNYKKGGEDITTVLKCSVWGKRAKVVGDYIKKGSFVAISGAAHSESFAKRDGTPGSAIAVRVSDFTLPPKPKSGGDDDLF